MSFWLFILCFGIAVLSGLGVGGGGLLAVILSLFSDLPALTVQGINLYFFLFAGSASLGIHLQKRKLRFGVILVCIVFGLLGTVIGSAFAHAVGGRTTRLLFGLLLILTGSASLFRCLSPLLRRKKEAKSPSLPEEPKEKRE